MTPSRANYDASLCKKAGFMLDRAIPTPTPTPIGGRGGGSYGCSANATTRSHAQRFKSFCGCGRIKSLVVVPQSSEASGSAACLVSEWAVVSCRNDSPFRWFRCPAGQGVARILVAMGLPLSSAARVTTASHSSSCCAKLMMSGEAWAWVTLIMVTMSLATSVMRPLMQVSF